MRAVGRGLVKVVKEEPTLIAGAIRATLLVVLVWLPSLSMLDVAGVMLAVEGWLNVMQRALVTPEAKVVQREEDAAAAAVELEKERAKAFLYKEDARASKSTRRTK